MIRALALTLALLALAVPGVAQESGGLDGIEQTYVRWLKEHNVQRASIAVAYGDRLVLAKGYGGLTPDSRVLIASLSKAITGVCVTRLIQDGKLRFDTPLGDVLARIQPGLPAPHDPRLRTVTIEQLLSHRAGFSRTGGDPATGPNLGEVLVHRPVNQATTNDLFPGVLATALEFAPGTKHVYTNAPHLLLGVVIEALTGERYEDYCGATVLRPHGIKKPTLHERWAVLGAFGGWSLSGAEYLAFYRDLAPASAALTRETRAWMLAPAGKETGNGTQFYSLLFVRPAPRNGYQLFHAGSWGYRLPASSKSGLINDSIGTRAIRTPSGVSWFVSYEPRPGGDALEALDRELNRATGAVTVWPETDLFPTFGLR